MLGAILRAVSQKKLHRNKSNVILIHRTSVSYELTVNGYEGMLGANCWGIILHNTLAMLTVSEDVVMQVWDYMQ